MLLTFTSSYPTPPAMCLLYCQIVDLATLTGACIIALGNDIAGRTVVTNECSRSDRQAGRQAGKQAGRQGVNSKPRIVGPTVLSVPFRA